MKIAFLWTDPSGYMAACWRKFLELEYGKVHVFAYGSSEQTSFSHDVMAGIPWTPLDVKQRSDHKFIASEMRQLKPDVLVVSGWLNSAYRNIATSREFSDLPKIMTMDTPWRGDVRQHLGLLRLRSYVRHFRAIVVPGERAWQYASRLTREAIPVYKGMYGVDFDRLSQVALRRLKADSWPRSFLFLGRYHSMKGLDLLIEAFRKYRSQVSDPWTLKCCGQGELKSIVSGEGIIDLGFLQPDSVLREMETAGCLVLPSRYDPWPLALVEGAAAGLPIIASSNCGSAVEVVRFGYSGEISQPTVDSISERLRRIHDCSDREQRTWSKRATCLAEPYSCTEWAIRWRSIAKALF